MNDDIATRLDEVRQRIDAACHRVGRDPDDITLVGISKTHGAGEIAVAVAAGLRDVGENRVQEAAPKIAALSELTPRPVWHMVGHLQSNKARDAAGLFDILHSVDSEHIADALSQNATRPLRVLIEVNVAGEASKFGVAPSTAMKLAAYVGRQPNIQLLGLMTVAPLTADPEEVRAVFRALRELRDAIGLGELSMGMTDDFEVAVEEGSTFVRVGRAIFGPRAARADAKKEPV